MMVIGCPSLYMNEGNLFVEDKKDYRLISFNVAERMPQNVSHFLVKLLKNVIIII